MIGLMDKMGNGMGNSAQMPGGSQLSALFQNLPQVPQTQVPQIAGPQYGPSLMPSPEQAAAATRARMLARTPMAAAPAAAPRVPKQLTGPGGEGGSRGHGT